MVAKSFVAVQQLSCWNSISFYLVAVFCLVFFKKTHNTWKQPITTTLVHDAMSGLGNARTSPESVLMSENVSKSGNIWCFNTLFLWALCFFIKHFSTDVGEISETAMRLCILSNGWSRVNTDPFPLASLNILRHQMARHSILPATLKCLWDSTVFVL